MSFIKFVWQDGKVFWIFVIFFIVVFHIGGMFYGDVTLRDIYPFYIMLILAGLTIVIYDWKKYNFLKNRGEL